MIRWIYQNIYHLTVPLGMLLGILAAVTTTIDRRRKKAGLGGVGRGYRFAVIVILVISSILGGMVLIRLTAA
jgi:hypothetical protein